MVSLLAIYLVSSCAASGTGQNYLYVQVVRKLLINFIFLKSIQRGLESFDAEKGKERI